MKYSLAPTFILFTVVVLLATGCTSAPVVEANLDRNRKSSSKEGKMRQTALSLAGEQALGHNRMVLYKLKSSGGTALLSQDMVGGVFGASDQHRELAACLADSHSKNLAVVIDSRSAAATERGLSSALKIINAPLPGLVIVTENPASPALTAQGAAQGVTFRTMEVPRMEEFRPEETPPSPAPLPDSADSEAL